MILLRSAMLLVGSAVAAFFILDGQHVASLVSALCAATAAGGRW